MYETLGTKPIGNKRHVHKQSLQLPLNFSIITNENHNN